VKRNAVCILLAAASVTFSAFVEAAELVTLSPQNYAEYAPKGKEAEAIFGDYVLRNDRIVLAVGNPDLISGRSAGRWGKPSVKGAIIDLTRREAQNDQLNAYYPGPLMFKPDAPQRQGDFVDEALTARRPDRQPVKARRVTLHIPPYVQSRGHTLADLAALPPSRRPKPETFVEVSYTLEDGWDFVLVEAVYRNPTARPVTLKLQTMLRADGTFRSGIDFDGRCFWVYDKWWAQAYGVLAEGHRIVPARPAGRAEHLLGYLANGKTSVTLEPGGEFRLVRRVIVGKDLFEVKAVAGRLLGVRVLGAKLTVRDPNGPVSGADVTASLGKKTYAAGRTDAAGSIDLPLPEGLYDVRIDAFGRGTAGLKITAGGRKARYEVDLPAAGYVAADVRDERGGPVPCKVEFRGRDGTVDPMFFPATGGRLVRNLRYTHTGRFRQIVPPGKYEVIITRGPEYDAVRRRIEVRPGRTTPLKVTLVRSVDTTGWISADFHNHSTLSAETDIFYVYPYSWNAAVDGDSSASQLGRVLNLLCEGIEFAPTTEHNTISSFRPLLESLGAEALLATADGIGLSAGRRHTKTHQNAFPVIYKPGKQDGGALQRPEHIQQLNWLAKWDEGGEKLIQINVPLGQKLSVRREMDVLDVRDLAPILAERPDPKAENRILEWLELLNMGYRLPGVIGSGAFDNFHGSGGVRMYVKSPTDDPAKIETLQVVRAAKRGNVVMTTGPFMEVGLSGAGSGAEASPGEEVTIPGGRAMLRVRVQCPNWIDIDRVQVLLNGKAAAKLNFTRNSAPGAFADGVVKFDRRIPLELKTDTHVIVVAAGRGPNLRARKGPQDDTARHLAVSNPIYVNVDGEQFQPHSPFDDKAEAATTFLKLPLARAGAEPGRLRVTIRNRGRRVARDVVTLQPQPENVVTILGEKTKPYSVAPGGEGYVDFDVVLSTEWLARGLPAVTYSYIFHRNPSIRVARSAVGEGRKGASIRLQVDHHAAQLPAIASVKHVAAALADQMVYPVRRRKVERLADVRFALAADQLALHMIIADAAPRRDKIFRAGSCVEVFGAMPRGRSIGQIFLLPRVGDAKAQARRQVNGKILPAPGVKMHTTPAPGGYELQALIPMSLLPVRPEEGVILLEFRVNTHAADGRVIFGTVFQSGAPDRDRLQFGRIRIADKVRARLEIVRPLTTKAGLPPGRVRVTLKNLTRSPAADELSLSARPAGAVRVAGPPTRPYKLAAGEEKTVDFDVTPVEGADAAAVEFHVPPTRRYEIVRSRPLKLVLLGGAAGRIDAIDSLDKLADALAGHKTFSVKVAGKPLADLRFAVAGAHLAVDAKIVDRKRTRGHRLWNGSCIEVYGSTPGTARIGQVFLVPRTDGRSDAAFVSDQGAPKPAPAVRLRTSPAANGYRLQALIPLSLLAVDPSADRCLLEFQITAAESVNRGGTVKLRRATLFGSTRAYNDNSKYGLLVLGE